MTDPTPPFRPARHTRPVVLADWRDAEELAAWHMRHRLRLPGAQLTGAGPDGGLDVTGDDAVAQVKHHTAPVGAPEVQQLRGAAHEVTHAIFYALSGYTPAAVAFAETAGVALFTYTVYGDVTAVTTVARTLAATAAGTPAEPPHDKSDEGEAADVGGELDVAAAADTARAAHEAAARREHARRVARLDEARRDAELFARRFVPSRPWTAAESADLRQFVLIATRRILVDASMAIARARARSVDHLDRMDRVRTGAHDLALGARRTLAAAGEDPDWPALIGGLQPWWETARELYVVADVDTPLGGDPERWAVVRDAVSGTRDQGVNRRWWDGRWEMDASDDVVHLERRSGLVNLDMAILDGSPFGLAPPEVARLWHPRAGRGAFWSGGPWRG